MIYIKSYCRCVQEDGIANPTHEVDGSPYPHCDICDLPVSARGDAVVRDLESLLDDLDRSHEARLRFYRNVLLSIGVLDLMLVAGLFYIDGTLLVYAVAVIFLIVASFTFNQTWRLHRDLGKLRLQHRQAFDPAQRTGELHRDHRRVKVRDRAGQISGNLERHRRR
jgi:hypothetical protein